MIVVLGGLSLRVVFYFFVNLVDVIFFCRGFFLVFLLFLRLGCLRFFWSYRVVRRRILVN